MSIKQYLRDNLIFILAQICVITFVIFLLYVMQVNVDTIIFIGICFMVADIVILTHGYIKKQKYYKQLEKTVDNLDKKFLLSELIEKPNFAEGMILYDVVKIMAKSMNDEIATYKIASEEYKEYIETWVHEIKTPIAAGKLIIENNKNQVTDSLNDEFDKINLFIEQALYYSKSSTLEKDYIIKEISLDQLVKAVVRRHSKSLIESKIELEFENLDVMVLCDEKWMGFILGQIIINSIKYRKRNPIISFYTEPIGNNVILFIKDNGIGISQKDIRRVFDKGFTGENGRKYAKSTGIGLYLCKKLSGKMQQKIEIYSKENIETVVAISLPKAK